MIKGLNFLKFYKTKLWAFKKRLCKNATSGLSNLSMVLACYVKKRYCSLQIPVIKFLKKLTSSAFCWTFT